MEIRAVYRCKLCGARIYRPTGIRPDRDLEDTLYKIIKHEELDYTSIPEIAVHNCAADKAGIAKLVGLKRWD